MWRKLGWKVHLSCERIGYTSCEGLWPQQIARSDSSGSIMRKGRVWQSLNLCISQMFALLQKVNQVEIDQVNSADSAFSIFINL